MGSKIIPFDISIIAEFTQYTKSQFLKLKQQKKRDILRDAMWACRNEDEILVKENKRLYLEINNNSPNKIGFGEQIKENEKRILMVRHEGQVLQDLFEGFALEGNVVYKEYAERYLF